MLFGIVYTVFGIFVGCLTYAELNIPWLWAIGAGAIATLTLSALDS